MTSRRGKGEVGSGFRGGMSRRVLVRLVCAGVVLLTVLLAGLGSVARAATLPPSLVGENFAITGATGSVTCPGAPNVSGAPLAVSVHLVGTTTGPYAGTFTADVTAGGVAGLPGSENQVSNASLRSFKMSVAIDSPAGDVAVLMDDRPAFVPGTCTDGSPGATSYGTDKFFEPYGASITTPDGTFTDSGIFRPLQTVSCPAGGGACTYSFFNSQPVFSSDGVRTQDTTPPVTTIGEFTEHDQRFISISATDPGADAAGVGETRCVLDPATPPASFAALPDAVCPYVAASLPVPAGHHTLWAASNDLVGNTETPVSHTFDFTPAPDDAPSVVSTVPAQGATGVETDANVSITFSEPVAVPTGITISCASSGAHAFSPSGDSTTFILNPTVSFAAGEACEVDVAASGVSDLDGNDPPDHPDADFTLTFTTDPGPPPPPPNAPPSLLGENFVVGSATGSVTCPGAPNVAQTPVAISVHLVGTTTGPYAGTFTGDVTAVGTAGQQGAVHGILHFFKMSVAIHSSSGDLAFLVDGNAGAMGTCTDGSPGPTEFAQDGNFFFQRYGAAITTPDGTFTDSGNFRPLFDVRCAAGGGACTYSFFNSQPVFSSDGVRAQDTTPPVTTIGQTTDIPPLVTVSVADPGVGAAGFGETRCVLDPATPPASFAALPAPPCPYTSAELPVPAGQHTLWVASNDLAGNEETPVSHTFDYTPPPDDAPSVASTVPLQDATGVATGATVTLNFSEPVTLTNALSINCASSGAHAFTSTPGQTTFVLTPTVPFVPNEVCTVQVLASGVSDVDLIDPPDHPAANFTLTFTTAPTPPDTAPPSVPAALRTTVVTGTSIGIGWDASTDDVGVAGYGVYRNGVRLGATGAVSVNVSGLTCGTSYTLAVDAFDAAGHTSAPASITASTAACGGGGGGGVDTQKPTVPSQLKTTAVTDTSIGIGWRDSTDDVGVAGYDVYLDGVRLVATVAVSVNISGLACGTSHTLAVDAFDAAGNTSAPTSITASTAACTGGGGGGGAIPTAPSPLNTTAVTDASIGLGWGASTDDAGVTGYYVYVDRFLRGTTAALSVNVSGLACGTTYTFGVSAFDAAAISSPNSEITASTLACGGSQT